MILRQHRRRQLDRPPVARPYHDHPGCSAATTAVALSLITSASASGDWCAGSGSPGSGSTTGPSKLGSPAKHQEWSWIPPS